MRCAYPPYIAFFSAVQLVMASEEWNY